ncbi:MAG: hypothetical protein IPG89_15305 [Bacteroidetes bacterium]|nr:hypothetical protein [Bacteroidota bacterium]
MKTILLLSILIVANLTINAQGLILNKEKYEKTAKWLPNKEFGLPINLSQQVFLTEPIAQVLDHKAEYLHV